MFVLSEPSVAYLEGHSGKDGKIAEDLPRTEKNWRAQPRTFLQHYALKLSSTLARAVSGVWVYVWIT